ncbi:hypothetical protein ACFQ1E_18470 [Sphingomonas canadensis]|uniref:Integrase n=1 Tax=Sphingomonas canadensis TaxID=1219257 RepID=A0ABW3HB83_9SPHN|nr:hypothetical protein [Sphingomonas canadensis]MCW3838132.1 hypothetical protein [Sphingomonas canadensis]
MSNRERAPETDTAPRRARWTTPDLIEAEIASGTQKSYSSTVDLYVPTFNRTLGPS